jgi:DNA-binding MarR family transcriptional regulator
MKLNMLLQLQRTVAVVRKEAPELPTQQLHVFMVVALDEGLTTKDIEKRCGMTNASASRNTQALYKMAGAGRLGLGWLTWEPSMQDGRVRQVYLSPKGKEILALIEAAMSTD